MLNPTTLTALVDELNQQFGNELTLSGDGQSVLAPSGSVAALLRHLKEERGFGMLMDITAVDLLQSFEVVYHIMKPVDAELLRIKVSLPHGAPVIPTATVVWKAADVMEREAYDLMGIVFEGHENLKRILCPDDFVGHPLRKDFKKQL